MPNQPSKTLYHFDLAITLVAPVLTQSVDARNIEVDAATLFYHGKPALSGSLITGNIRHRLTEFIHLAGDALPESFSQQTIDQWFGRPSTLGSFAAARRTVNLYNYFTLDQVNGKTFNPEQLSPHSQTRIQINPATGTVSKGALNVMETLFQSGSRLTFKGGFSVLLAAQSLETTNQQTLNKIQHWLDKALTSLSALGSNKGIGFGRIESHHITATKTVSLNESTTALPTADASRLRFALTPLEPFCIAKPHGVDSNRFEAESDISGGVIRGCLARYFTEEQLESATFEKWIATHAKPVKQESLEQASFNQSTQQPQPLPLSLASLGYHNKDGKSYLVCQDMIQQPAGLITLTGHSNALIPEFSTDWKHRTEETISEHWHSAADLDRLLRVRTSLGKRFATHNALQAEDGQLFSMELIDPANHTWLFEMDLSRLTETEQHQALTMLSQVVDKELVGLGKTNSRYRIEFLQSSASATVPPLADNPAGFRIQLASDARLFNNEQAQKVSNINGAQHLHERYDQYWAKVSGNSVTLIRHFTSQHMVGGQYQRQRFQNGQPYQPIWLCDAGSVFFLEAVKGKEQQAKACVEEWLKLGLPQPDDNNDWQRNPWIRENGYGEIIVNRSDIHPSEPIWIEVKESSDKQNETSDTAQGAA